MPSFFYHFLRVARRPPVLFSQRLIQPELLDRADPDVARRNLKDLVRINRYFGGHSTIEKTLAAVASRDEPFTLLDIGAASGDTARLVAQQYPRASITSLDYNPVNLEQAPLPKLIADAFALPLRAKSFDYVQCSLFLHHFRDEEVVELLARFYEVARKALLVIDLERNVLPYWFLPLTRPLYGWGWITVHDGQISVRAAFSKRELLALAAKAGISGATVRKHRPAFRLALVARKL